MPGLLFGISLCFFRGVTDFLPVGEAKDDEVLERGVESETSDEEERGMEHAFQGGGSDFFDVFPDGIGQDGPDGIGEDRQCMSDDFGSFSEMAATAPLYDGEGTHAEPELEGDDLS